MSHYSQLGKKVVHKHVGGASKILANIEGLLYCAVTKDALYIAGGAACPSPLIQSELN